MTNLRKSAIATLAAVAALGASALATPSTAHAGSKTELAKAVVAGLIVGAIAATAQQPQPVVVVKPRRHRHFHNGGFQRAGFNGQNFGGQNFGGQNFGGQDCFTQEEVTVDRFGNRASSIRTICQ